MKKLLIADDVTTNLRLVTEVLKDEYEIATAKSGEQALFLIKSFKPDIILLDIGMPRMDGYAVMDRIKSDPQTAGIPVIFLTADITKEAEAKALNSGAMDYIRKPFEPLILKTRLERALAITDEKKVLENESKIDFLTGAWNRNCIEEKINSGQISQGFFLMMDLDNFKGLNDCLGHIIGDKALEIFADTLKEFAEEDDLVCRLGGDEFVFWKNGEADRNQIRKLSRDIIVAVEMSINKLVNDEMDKLVSVSIGIAQLKVDGENFQELYSTADKALYFVKQNGKRGYHFYQDDSQEKDDINVESSLIDIQELKNIISENTDSRGAYQVEYEAFKKIYRFVNRYTKRTGQSAQIVLFTLMPKSDSADAGIMKKSMDIMETNITGLLRRADVASKFSNNQFVVILVNTSEKNGMIAVRRVLDNFGKEGLSDMIDVKYDIQNIGGEEQ